MLTASEQLVVCRKLGKLGGLKQGWVGLVPSGGSRGDFLTSYSFWGLWFLGLWPHRSNLCLHLHTAFSCGSVSPLLSLIRTV